MTNPTDQSAVEPLSAEDAGNLLDMIYTEHPQLEAVRDKKHRCIDLSKHVVCGREPYGYLFQYAGGMGCVFYKDKPRNMKGMIPIYSESPEAT